MRMLSIRRMSVSFFVAGSLLALFPVQVFAESDASLEYSIALDRSTIRLGQSARLLIHYRNIGDETIKTFGPVVEIPTRFKDCRAPVIDPTGRTWENLRPGEAKYLAWAVPLDHGVDDVLIGQHEIKVRLGHTSGNQSWTIKRKLLLTIEPVNLEDYSGFEEFWIDRVGCDNWDNGKTVQLSYFDLYNAHEAAWRVPHGIENKHGFGVLPPDEHFVVFFSDRYQDFLRLRIRHAGVRRRQPNELFDIMQGALDPRGMKGNSAINQYQVDLPWEIEHTGQAAPKLEYSVYVAHFRGRVAAIEYLEALSKEPLSPFDAAIAVDLLEILRRSNKIENPPNLGVPADRDPPERGSRPLNTDR